MVLSHTSFFATFIHINATSTQLFPTAICTVSLIYLCSYTAVGVIKYIVIWTKKSKTKKSFW